MPKSDTWPGGVAMEPLSHLDSAGSCDSVISMNSGYSEDSMEHLSPEERACLMYLEETIEALEVQEDSGLSNDEPDPGFQKNTVGQMRVNDISSYKSEFGGDLISEPGFIEDKVEHHALSKTSEPQFSSNKDLQTSINLMTQPKPPTTESVADCKIHPSATQLSVFMDGNGNLKIGPSASLGTSQSTGASEGDVDVIPPPSDFMDEPSPPPQPQNKVEDLLLSAGISKRKPAATVDLEQLRQRASVKRTSFITSLIQEHPNKPPELSLPTVSSGPPMSTIVSSGPPMSTTVSSGPPMSTTASSGPPMSTTASSSPPMSTTASSGPPMSPTVSSGPPMSPTVSSGPPMSTTASSGPPMSTTASSGPPMSTTASSSPPMSTTASSGPPMSPTVSSGPPMSPTVSSSPPMSPETAEPRSPPVVAPKPKKLPANIFLKPHKAASDGLSVPTSSDRVLLDPQRIRMEALRKLGLLPAEADSGPVLSSDSPPTRKSSTAPASPVTPGTQRTSPFIPPYNRFNSSPGTCVSLHSPAVVSPLAAATAPVVQPADILPAPAAFSDPVGPPLSDNELSAVEDASETKAAPLSPAALIKHLAPPRLASVKAATLERSNRGLSRSMTGQDSIKGSLASQLRNNRARPASLGSGTEFTGAGGEGSKVGLATSKEPDLRRSLPAHTAFQPLRDSPKLPRSEGISVLICPRAENGEDRRSALKKLGLLRD